MHGLSIYITNDYQCLVVALSPYVSLIEDDHFVPLFTQCYLYSPKSFFALNQLLLTLGQGFSTIARHVHVPSPNSSSARSGGSCGEPYGEPCPMIGPGRFGSSSRDKFFRPYNFEGEDKANGGLILIVLEVSLTRRLLDFDVIRP